MIEEDENKIPVKELSPYFSQCYCDERPKYKDLILNSMNQRYVLLNNDEPNMRLSSWIDLVGFDYDNYIAKVKKKHKGSAIRHSKKADEAEYYCKVFRFENFIPDVYEINTSKEIRCERPMAQSYRRSIEELGGYPTEMQDIIYPKCNYHWRLSFGIFKSIPGYKQGDLVTDEKLLGYINTIRNGNYMQYSQILGHGDFLKDGIMYNLHFFILRWIQENRNNFTKDLQHLWYANHDCKIGPLQWKEKVLFIGVHYIVKGKNKLTITPPNNDYEINLQKSHIINIDDYLKRKLLSSNKNTKKNTNQIKKVEIQKLDFNKENCNTSYRNFLSLFDGEFVTFHEYLQKKDIDKRYVILRHDLDRHMEGVLEMAGIENNMNIKSTYFPLHTSPYFDYSTKFFDLWKKVKELGHEIGIHNDFLWEYIINKKRKISLNKIIEKPIKRFRLNGFNIYGTSSHGNSELFSKYNLRNFDVFKECGEINNYLFNQLSFKDYELEYEAYYIGHNYYLTDTMGYFLALELTPDITPGRTPIVGLVEQGKNIGLKRVIEEFNSLEKGLLQILVHVPRWNLTIMKEEDQNNACTIN